MDQVDRARRLRRAVVRLFRRGVRRPLTVRQIAYLLSVEGGEDRLLLDRILEELHQGGVIEKVARGKFRAVRRLRTVQGVLEVTRSGVGFVVHPRFRRDILVPVEWLNGAIDKDLVEVGLLGVRRGRWIGRVLRVVERGRRQVPGVIDFQGATTILRPFLKTLPPMVVEDIEVEVRQGDAVVGELLDWRSDQSLPHVRVVQRLASEARVRRNQMILLSCGFPLEFPDEVLREADALPEEIPEEEWEYRADLRFLNVFTIDPVDARDFDDALSIRRLSEDVWEVGIHIADVSWYVREGSAIDREARRRATSVYLVDEVLPMLPERLSSYLCSLRPNEDKLAFSVLVEVDSAGQIRGWRAVRSIIRSRYRFTYEEAQRVLELGEGVFVRELRQLWTFARVFRERRRRQGALLIDLPEPYFELDVEGSPSSVVIPERKESHWLVEEWMLVANRLVAERMAGVRYRGQRYPFIYRVHEPPPADKLRELRRVLRLWKIPFRMGRTTLRDPQRIAKRLSALADVLAVRAEAPVLLQMLIRTMAKAQYSVEARGHFGLQFRYYTHFTSPIRRYPDLVVHRLFWRYLQREGPGISRKRLAKIAVHATRQEMEAMEAEHLSVRYMMCELAGRWVGRRFAARIVGLGPRAVYVLIPELYLEGVLFAEENGLEIRYRRWMVRRQGRTYVPGELICVELDRVDHEDGTVVFRWVDSVDGCGGDSGDRGAG